MSTNISNGMAQNHSQLFPGFSMNTLINFFLLLVFLSKEKMAAIDLYSLCVMEKAGHDLICKGQPSHPALRNTSVLQKQGFGHKADWELALIGSTSWHP